MPLKRTMNNFLKGKSMNRLSMMNGCTKFCSFISVIIIFSSCTAARIQAYDPESKIAPGKLQQDFILLKKILETNHPSLYWYTPKDSIDAYFSTVLNSITDSLTETQFRNKVAWFISRIHCGHTSVRPSKSYSEYFPFNTQPQFPLAIKAWEDSLVVMGNANRKDSLLKRGTIITSIDNLSNGKLLDSMFQFISTDGYSDNFKDQVSSFNFSNYYTNAFPLKDSIAINFIDSAGNTQSTFIKPFKPIVDTVKNKKSIPSTTVQQKTSHKQSRQLKLQNIRRLIFDTANHLAYMRVASFTGGHLRNFFKKSFDTLKYTNTKNLVIDLRENAGGSVSASTVLTRYIAAKPFHIADTVAAISRSFPYGKYIHPSLVYRVVMRFTTHKGSDDRFHFTTLERHMYQPYTNLHYDGNVYIIQGGFTFSAAAMFVSHIKGQQNVTVVGEETGGGNYGMNAVHLPTVILPNSKIKIVLPIYRVVLDSKRAKNGRGIQPDILIEPSPDALKKGIDLKLQKIRELIKEKEEKK